LEQVSKIRRAGKKESGGLFCLLAALLLAFVLSLLKMGGTVGTASHTKRFGWHSRLAQQGFRLAQ